MQVSTNVASSRVATNLQADAVAVQEQQNRYEDYKVIRRNGAVVGFEPAKINVALTKAFIAVSGGQGAASARIREVVTNLDRSRGHSAHAPAACRRHSSY